MPNMDLDEPLMKDWILIKNQALNSEQGSVKSISFIQKQSNENLSQLNKSIYKGGGNQTAS